MDRLPIELLEMIFDKILWGNPEELYRLRTVSRTWKSVADRTGSRVFKYWYNRCKTEIPEDHLVDIVQTKYPLLAQPWRECYWVDRSLPHVAKNIYDIWKSFPDLNDGIDVTRVNFDWPLEGYSFDTATVCMNDKYFAVSSYDADVCDDETRRGTLIYRSNNLEQYIRQYDIISDQIEFYTTGKGTFIVLSHYLAKNNFEIYISKYPIDNLDLPPELVLLGRNEKYCITQSECFYIPEDESIDLKTLEHKILTERGFEMSTIIELPPGMLKRSCGRVRVEICGCTLYVMQKQDMQLSIAKYNISRNVDGKLSFTLENWKVLNEYNDEYNCISSLLSFNFRSENLYLTDLVVASEKFNSWLYGAYDEDVKALAVHANYVFCAEHQKNLLTRICICRKDDLYDSIEADDPERLVFPDIGDLRYDYPSDPWVNWIGIIYIGVKAKILLQFHHSHFCLISFY